MERPRRHGIPRGNDRKKTKYRPKDPDYKHGGDVEGVLKDWADSWKDWIGDLAGEFKKAIKEYPEKAANYEGAKADWNVFGNALQTTAADLIEKLYPVYTPDPPPQEKGGFVTDATKPPPPPFGGGKDNEGEDDDD